MGPKARADMKRRNLILALGGVVVAWQAAGRAQQSSGPVIGFLSPQSPEESSHLVAAFRRGLAEGGFVEGQNVSIEFRWARGQYDLLPAMAAGFLVVSLMATESSENCVTVHALPS